LQSYEKITSYTTVALFAKKKNRMVSTLLYG
jgi:hypothetical protein